MAARGEGSSGPGPEAGNPTPGPEGHEITLQTLSMAIKALQATIDRVGTNLANLETTVETLGEAVKRLEKKPTPSGGSKGKGKDEGGSGGGPGLGRGAEELGKGIKFVLPGFYDGKEKGKTAKQWLSKIMIYLAFKHNSFPNEVTRMFWFLTQMEGIAGDWAQTKIKQIGKEGDETTQTMQTLSKEFKNYFNDPDARKAAHRKITSLTMTGSAPEYTLEFQNLQAYLEWNDQALVDQYRLGLSQRIRSILATQKDQPSTLTEMISEVHRIDGQLRENDAEKAAHKTTTSTTSQKAKASTSTTTEAKKGPLTESPNYVSKEIRDRRKNEGLCIKCGRKGHSAKDCRTGWKKEDQGNKEAKKETGKVAKEEEELDSEDSDSGKV